jgi:hypothetical protein
MGRLNATKEFYREIKDGLSIISGSGKNSLQNDARSSMVVSPTSPNSSITSRHSAATTAAAQRKLGLIFMMQERLEEAERDVRDAVEAFSVGQEDLQCAIAEKEMAEKFIDNIEAQIFALKETITSHQDRLRQTWEVPEDVWRYIFQLVVYDGEEGSTITPISVRTLVLSDVCFYWRRIISRHRDLWPSSVVGGWDTVESINISSNNTQDVHLLTISIPLLSNLCALEIPGGIAPQLLPYLTGVTSLNTQTHLYSNNLPVVSNQLLLPSLKRIVLVQYQGTGQDVLDLAEARQVHLGGKLPYIPSTTSEEEVYLKDSNNAAHFVEYCSRRVGKEEIQKALDKEEVQKTLEEEAIKRALEEEMRRSLEDEEEEEGEEALPVLPHPSSAASSTTPPPTETLPFNITVSMFGALNMAYKSNCMMPAMDQSCNDIANRLKGLYPEGWRTFWKKNRPAEKILFKVDLRNHVGLDPAVLDKLKAYF